MKEYFSSEYVGIGHPDKVADQISDSILDLYLKNDPKARVAAETLVSGNKVILAGEISSSCYFNEDDIRKTIINTVVDAGYNKNVPCQFREDNLDINIFLKPQSPNINYSVDKSDGDIGAGDQGIMFGYATDNSHLQIDVVKEHYLPIPYLIASTILNELNIKIRDGKLPGIYTDNKSQVCCSYNNGDLLIEKIILSSFHNPDIDVEEVRRILKTEVIDDVVEKFNIITPRNKNIEIFINSAGPFWVGGPEADAGLTGRKIIVDTYGGFAPHGGGAFSGKDPSKVDRSAAYMARHIAKTLVANGLATEILVQLSYAIGQTQPFSIHVKSVSKGWKDFQIVEIIKRNFDLSPKGIIEYLGLTDSNIVEYRKVASGGHFISSDVPWEKIKLL